MSRSTGEISVLRLIAARIRFLIKQSAELDIELLTLVPQHPAGPTLLAEPGVGPVVAAQLLACPTSRTTRSLNSTGTPVTSLAFTVTGHHPSGSEPLPTGATRLHKPSDTPLAGLIDDQHRAGISERLDDIPAQVIADRVGVPARPGQQVLQPVRCDLATVLSDRPTVLAVQPRQHPKHQSGRVPHRLVADKIPQPNQIAELARLS